MELWEIKPHNMNNMISYHH